MEQDINDKRTGESLPKSEFSAYSFWVGMPLNTQMRILELCACSACVSLTVFKDRKWNGCEVEQILNQSSPEGLIWRWNQVNITTHMHGSGEVYAHSSIDKKRVICILRVAQEYMYRLW